jgi:hypothetical protein
LWGDPFKITLAKLPLVLAHQLLCAALVLCELSDELRAVRRRQVAALAANAGRQFQLVLDILFPIYKLGDNKINRAWGCSIDNINTCAIGNLADNLLLSAS